MLFVYGSLISPKVVTFVLGHPHTDFVVATVKGFHRYQIHNRTYPALCALSGEENIVQGLLLQNLSKEDISRLDEFEGDEYQRVPVQVQVENSLIIHDAFVYIWAKGKEDLYGEWSFEKHFKPIEEKQLKLWSGEYFN